MSATHEVQARAWWNPHGFVVEIFANFYADGARHAGEPVDFRTLEPGAPAEPILRLTERQAQQLSTDLWNSGIRPDQAKDSTELVEALKLHRDDAVKVRDRALDIALDAERS